MENVSSRGGNYFFELIKALIISLIISLVLVLGMAFAIKLLDIPTSAISIINQVIKGVSILFGALICLKLPSNGWIRGLAFGILYVCVTFAVFSLLDGEGFVFGITLLNDVAVGSISGLISGIIAVNLRNH